MPRYPTTVPSSRERRCWMSVPAQTVVASVGFADGCAGRAAEAAAGFGSESQKPVTCVCVCVCVCVRACAFACRGVRCSRMEVMAPKAQTGLL